MISVIIPVYNGEKYIRETLDSLLKQTFSNFEIIIINDGSTDNTYNICESYQKKTKNIFIYEQENKGVSSARNYGLKKAIGKYIYFMDADDTLQENAFETMIKYIKNYDLLTFGYIEDYPDDKKAKGYLENKILNQEEAIEIALKTDNSFQGYLWNKLFVHSIIDENTIQFDENITICEDLLFLIKYLFNCKTICTRKEKLYYYRMRKSGASKKFNVKKFTSMFSSYEQILDLLKKRKIQNVVYLEYEYLFHYYFYKKMFEKNTFHVNIKQMYQNVITSNGISNKKKHELFLIKNMLIIYKIKKRLKREQYNAMYE